MRMGNSVVKVNRRQPTNKEQTKESVRHNIKCVQCVKALIINPIHCLVKWR